MSDHKHDWVFRTDGDVQDCFAAICTICGEYSCTCRVVRELGRPLSDDEFETFVKRGIPGNDHERADAYAKEENDVVRSDDAG